MQAKPALRMKAACQLGVNGRRPVVPGNKSPAFKQQGTQPAPQTSIKPDLIANGVSHHRIQKQGTTIHGNNHASKHRYHAVAYSQTANYPYILPAAFAYPTL